MKQTLIIYSSNTGNTRELAEQIYAGVGEDQVLACIDVKEFYKMKEEESRTILSQADYIYAGFWTDKGSCEEQMSQFLKNLKNKNVFLYGTAGFGGEAPYFEQILSRVKSNLDASNTIIGTYMCQGKMPASVRARYESMLDKNPKMQQMIENYDRALSHPNQEDISLLLETVKKSRM